MSKLILVLALFAINTARAETCEAPAVQDKETLCWGKYGRAIYDAINKQPALVAEIAKFESQAKFYTEMSKQYPSRVTYASIVNEANKAADASAAKLNRARAERETAIAQFNACFKGQ